MALRVGSLRRTNSVAIEGIADIRRSLAARRSDANDPKRSSGHLEFYQVSDRWETYRKRTEPLPGSLVAVTAHHARKLARDGGKTEAGAVTSPGHEVPVVATERTRRRC